MVIEFINLNFSFENMKNRLPGVDRKKCIFDTSYSNKNFLRHEVHINVRNILPIPFVCLI